MNNKGKMMKKFILSSFFFLVATAGFAETLIIDNQTLHPLDDQKSKIAIQWAGSAKETVDANHAMIYGFKLNQDKLQILDQTGRMTVKIPEKTAHFRILVWTKGEENPDRVTNWVDVLPNKTYTLKSDHLVPAILMSGTGC